MLIGWIDGGTVNAGLGLGRWEVIKRIDWRSKRIAGAYSLSLNHFPAMVDCQIYLSEPPQIQGRIHKACQRSNKSNDGHTSSRRKGRIR
jgi:hypothetical protein